MVLENGVYTSFQPKFKNLDEDRERYLFAILDLHEAGKIEKPDGHSLYSAYAEQGYAWIDAQYWERGLHDLIEAYHCHSEIAFGPIYEGSLKIADRFVELGEAHRGRRIWRNHLASQLMHYWFYADEKRKGFRMAKGWLAPEEEQRQDHERIVAKLPEKKAELLKMLQAYRDWLIATDAPPATWSGWTAMSRMWRPNGAARRQASRIRAPWIRICSGRSSRPGWDPRPPPSASRPCPSGWPGSRPSRFEISAR
jgi:hypothetical protein